jgi:hypothetical protein
LPSRLEYFPDDFDQLLTYLELPYYQYEFERKKRRLETRWRQEGWLNNEVRYGAICHDSKGNVVDGLDNPIKEAEEVVEEEERQEKDEGLEFKPKQEQEEIQKWQEEMQKWHLDYIQLMERIKNPKYISHCVYVEAQRIF